MFHVHNRGVNRVSVCKTRDTCCSWSEAVTDWQLLGAFLAHSTINSPARTEQRVFYTSHTQIVMKPMRQPHSCLSHDPILDMTVQTFPGPCAPTSTPTYDFPLRLAFVFHRCRWWSALRLGVGHARCRISTLSLLIPPSSYSSRNFSTQHG